MKASGGHTLNPNWRRSLFLVNKLSLYVHVKSRKRPFIYHLIFPIILRWTKCTTCKGITRPSKSEESQSATNLPTPTLQEATIPHGMGTSSSHHNRDSQGAPTAASSHAIRRVELNHHQGPQNAI